jgi:hypothetical protein
MSDEFFENSFSEYKIVIYILQFVDIQEMKKEIPRNLQRLRGIFIPTSHLPHFPSRHRRFVSHVTDLDYFGVSGRGDVS